MDFGYAITAMRAGHKIQREAWQGTDMYLDLQVPDRHSKMTIPYIYIHTGSGELVPWVAPHAALLAEDWALYAETD